MLVCFGFFFGFSVFLWNVAKQDLWLRTKLLSRYPQLLFNPPEPSVFHFFGGFSVFNACCWSFDFCLIGQYVIFSYPAFLNCLSSQFIETKKNIFLSIVSLAVICRLIWIIRHIHAFVSEIQIAGERHHFSSVLSDSLFFRSLVRKMNVTLIN